VTIGVHTPEFKFEHDLDNVRWAVEARKIDYPIAIDNDFEVWRAFANHYWPALYFVDSQGRIRHHRFGEGDFERSEMVIRQLLLAAGVEDLRPGLATVEPNGDEVQADWEDLGSPESYLGYDQATGFDAGGRAAWDEPHTYTAPAHLRLNRWGLTGNWTVRSDASALNGSNGRLVYQFHARDVNLVMGPARKGATARFRVLLDGESAGAVHGADVDADGNGTVAQQRMYQLIRQAGPIRDRRFEIEFLDGGHRSLLLHVWIMKIHRLSNVHASMDRRVRESVAALERGEVRERQLADRGGSDSPEMALLRKLLK
jgi:hypothetical protein